MFTRSHRVNKDLYFVYASGCASINSYFAQLEDRTGKKGLTRLQKVTSAMCILVCGLSDESLD